ncbi:MAG TPA: hypothetical protein DEP53_20120 [Bacteroidetes bacterium]|nr:hypothetical protein [Bacteroidota bacterium]
MKRFTVAIAAVLILSVLALHAQDSVDVTFRYKPTISSPSVVFVPGEFNGWGPNSSGFISPSAPSRMDWDPTTGSWTKTVRLRIGFGGTPPTGIAGAYQYKFNEDGSKWLADPLNPRVNAADAGNSYLFPTNPTIYQFVPNQITGMVKTSTPLISAFVFPKVGQVVDTSSITLRVDSTMYVGIGRSYDPVSKKLSFRVPDPLTNGSHRFWLRVGDISDSSSIVVQAGAVQITSLGNFVTRKSSRTIYGSVEDTSIHTVAITRNDADTAVFVVTAGLFSAQMPLVEGTNVFRAIVGDAGGATQVSDPVTFSYLANHAPDADIYFIAAGANLILSAQGSSDPDSGQSARLKFTWKADPGNPAPIAAVDGATTSQVVIAAPSVRGDYFFTLNAEDPDGNRDTTRNYVSVLPDGTVEPYYLATSPRWARQGRLYELFFKSMTQPGTINAAVPYLPYLKSLGVNILWVMPIMENAAPINNRSGPGYNIKNLFKVAPEYGTNDDFKNFVRQAHTLGLKVILDVTPNHTSYLHPFVLEAKQYRQNSPYWDFYQHSEIPHNTNGLGQSSADGFVYYSGFSSQLLNYNWSDLDARSYMIEVYKWWVREFDIDGYRFDVYWGPRRRAVGGQGSELEMGVPVRKALRKIKPDIFLLAEDDGTGAGTEVIFADQSGGVDAGYDWVLYGGAIRPFGFDVSSIENLHAKYFNNNFYPGKNALFLRFMENHDEERIVAVPTYGSYQKTMPVATTLFTVPGLPMIYSGQEVGFGLGIGDYDQRRRGVIDWSAAGRTLLLPHYQRLALIRAQYSAFSSQKMTRLSTANAGVYAYLRPGAAGDALVAVNFTSVEQPIQFSLTSQLFESPALDAKSYYLNDVYNDTTYLLVFQGGQASFSGTLKPFGSLICIKSDSIRRITLPPLVSVRADGAGQLPKGYVLLQNYPNPFNPGTAISFQLSDISLVKLTVYDILGREVANLVDGVHAAGTHALHWNAGSLPSGIYVCRLTLMDAGGGGSRRDVRAIKMLLLR